MLIVQSPQETKENLELINREVTPNFEIGYININDVRIIERYTLTVDRNRLYNINFLDPNGVTGGLSVGTIGINVSVPTQYEVNLEQKEVTIDQNGTTVIVPSEGYDGLEQIEITTDVQPNIQLFQYATINQNGQYTYTPSEGYDGLGRVTVNVGVPQPAIESNRQWTVSSNGNFTIVPNISRDAMSSVDLTVDVPNSTQTKEITTNGTYTPDSGYIGFSSVSVNVPTTANLQSVIANVNGNGTQVVTPSAGYDGLSQVTINTNVDKRAPIRYISCSENKAVTSFVDLVSYEFDYAYSGTTHTVTLQPGRTLLVLYDDATSYIFKVNQIAANGTAYNYTITQDHYYTVINYGPSAYMYFFDTSDNILIQNTFGFDAGNSVRKSFELKLLKSSFVLPNLIHN